MLTSCCYAVSTALTLALVRCAHLWPDRDCADLRLLRRGLAGGLHRRAGGPYGAKKSTHAWGSRPCSNILWRVAPLVFRYPAAPSKQLQYLSDSHPAYDAIRNRHTLSAYSGKRVHRHQVKGRPANLCKKGFPCCQHCCQRFSAQNGRHLANATFLKALYHERSHRGIMSARERAARRRGPDVDQASDRPALGPASATVDRPPAGPCALQA